MSTVIADDRGRVQVAEPGEQFDVSRDAQGGIILRKVQTNLTDLERIPVVQLGPNGELIWPKDSRKPSAAGVAQAVREERDR